MTDEPQSKNNPERSWLERLSHILLREPKDREQLIDVLRDAESRELFDADALSMIEGVLQVSEMQVRDIMVPRSQMVTVQEDEKLEEFLPILIESAHSRFPVIGANRDEMTGILLAKDLLKFVVQKDNDNFNLRDVVRPAIVVPESKRLDALLKEFRISHNHMAVVVDEYGGVSGLVTIEDVLEQIVGEIEDESDVDEEDNIKKHSEVEFTIKALTPIDEFNDFFKLNFSDEEFDTIGGLVTNAFGHLPKRGETVVIDGYDFKVLHADNRRIRLLQARVLESVSE